MPKNSFWLPFSSKLINQTWRCFIPDCSKIFWMLHSLEKFMGKNKENCPLPEEEVILNDIASAYLTGLLLYHESNPITTLHVSVILWILTCFLAQTTSKYIIMNVCPLLIFIVTALARHRLLYLFIEFYQTLKNIICIIKFYLMSRSTLLLKSITWT